MYYFIASMNKMYTVAVLVCLIILIVHFVKPKKYKRGILVLSKINSEQAMQILKYLNVSAKELISYMDHKYDNPENKNEHGYILYLRLKRRYTGNLQEIHPINGATTAWTKNKGELVSMCLRKKDSDADEFHDIDILTFVFIHELAHIASESYGHEDEFWINFKVLLLDAQEAGLYKPVDYQSNAVNYCGLDVVHNPIFDPTI